MAETTEMTFKKIGYSSENGKKKLSVITDKGQNIRIEVFGSFNPDNYPDNQWYSASIKVKQGERTTFYDLQVRDGQEPLKPVLQPSNTSTQFKKSFSEDGYDKRMALQYAVQTIIPLATAGKLVYPIPPSNENTLVANILEIADKYYAWLKGEPTTEKKEEHL